MADTSENQVVPTEEESRRDFLLHATVATGAVGVAVATWPLINSMNPAADTLALSSVEVSLSSLQEGQAITISWRGKPVFARYRTPAEIEEARSERWQDMPDPQPDEERVQDERYLIGVGGLHPPWVRASWSENNRATWRFRGVLLPLPWFSLR